MLRRSPTSPSLHALRVAERPYKRLRISANSVTGWTENDPEVLDRFWKARGVTNEEHRKHLVQCGYDALKSDVDAEVWQESATLPGAGAYWQLQWDTELQIQPSRAQRCSRALSNLPSCWHLSLLRHNIQVQALSQRLWELHNLLGRRMDIDTGKMIAACPSLLSAKIEQLTERLVMMKVTPGAEGMDIGKLVEAQPSLLLVQSRGDESVAAWAHGLTTASGEDWATKLPLLHEYIKQHGDLHIGFRASDDPEVVKLARMLRHEYRKGQLSSESIKELDALGFEFDAGAAEWHVMYKQLKALLAAEKEDRGLIDGQSDFLLNNWCSVQRISFRSGVLRADRKELLDVLEFDWTGADALS